jgi:hypothetical protein
MMLRGRSRTGGAGSRSLFARSCSRHCSRIGEIEPMCTESRWLSFVTRTACEQTLTPRKDPEPVGVAVYYRLSVRAAA